MDTSDDARIAAELQKQEMQHSPNPIQQPTTVVYAQSTPMHTTAGTVGTVPMMTGIVVQNGNVQTVASSAAVDPALVLSDNEALMFSYKCSVQCFALIDIILSLLSLFSGNLGALIALVTLIGPVLGYYGAGNLNKGCVVTYLVFCVIKTIIQIVLMVSYGNFYYIFIAIIQLWITKIVYSFCTALNRIDVDRLTVLRRPGFLGAALHQSNVVIATRYY